MGSIGSISDVRLRSTNAIMPQERQFTPEEYAAMEPDKVLRTMQIIASALIAGVLMFGGVASVIVFGQAPAAQQGPNGANVLVYLSSAMAAMQVVLSFVVPNLVSASGVKGIAKMAQDGTSTGPKELMGRLMGVAQTRMIIAMALLEGAAFFCLISFISTKSTTPPAVVSVLVMVMTVHFPTKLRVANWLEDQQRLLS